MDENVTNQKRKIDIQIYEAKRPPNRLNLMNRLIPRHVIKLLKVKTKKKM